MIVDELSAPVLVLGLRARGDGFTARTLQLHADAWEPCRISTRQLLRERLDWQATPHVFVCENPAIIAAAASWPAKPCAPLICVEGQPTTSARLLLSQLDAAGSTLHYHGDFDWPWPGVTIANFVIRAHGARAWRMFAADYLAADDLQGARLRGAVVETTWDPELGAAMQARGLAAHKEQVVEQFLGRRLRALRSRSKWLTEQELVAVVAEKLSPLAPIARFKARDRGGSSALVTALRALRSSTRGPSSARPRSTPGEIHRSETTA